MYLTDERNSVSPVDYEVRIEIPSLPFPSFPFHSIQPFNALPLDLPYQFAALLIYIYIFRIDGSFVVHVLFLVRNEETPCLFRACVLCNFNILSYNVFVDKDVKYMSGIFDSVPEQKPNTSIEFEWSDVPHLPTYNLPLIKDDVIVGYVI